MHVKMHHLAIERLAAPWPQRMRNKEKMPKEGRRIKEDNQQGGKVRSTVVVLGRSLLLIIILVQCLSKKIFYHLLRICILYRDIVTGKNQGGTRNLSACRKKGEESRRIISKGERYVLPLSSLVDLCC